jgi:hypothetical protein
LREIDYYTPLTDLRGRARRLFLTVPVGFMFRDDWDDQPNLEHSKFQRHLIINFGFQEYFNSTSQRRAELYTDLIGALWATGKPQDKNYSLAILEEALFTYESEENYEESDYD